MGRNNNSRNTRYMAAQTRIQLSTNDIDARTQSKYLGSILTKWQGTVEWKIKEMSQEIGLSAQFFRTTSIKTHTHSP